MQMWAMFTFKNIEATDAERWLALCMMNITDQATEVVGRDVLHRLAKNGIAWYESLCQPIDATNAPLIMSVPEHKVGVEIERVFRKAGMNRSHAAMLGVLGRQELEWLAQNLSPTNMNEIWDLLKQLLNVPTPQLMRLVEVVCGELEWCFGGYPSLWWRTEAKKYGSGYKPSMKAEGEKKDRPDMDDGGDIVVLAALQPNEEVEDLQKKEEEFWEREKLLKEILETDGTEVEGEGVMDAGWSTLPDRAEGYDEKNELEIEKMIWRMQETVKSREISTTVVGRISSFVTRFGDQRV